MPEPTIRAVPPVATCAAGAGISGKEKTGVGASTRETRT